MADYPYTTVTGKITTLLAKMREVGVPAKATNVWLRSIGFKSSNDSSLLPVLRFIELTDSSGIPTDDWKQFRGADHGQILANCIRKGYSDLFAVYPDANERPASEIEHVISTTSTAGKQAITKTVRTFQNLCKEGDFSAVGEASTTIAQVQNTSENPSHAKLDDATKVSGNTPSLHIDIQIHISPDSSPQQVDQIFESMAKHLYKSKG